MSEQLRQAFALDFRRRNASEGEEGLISLLEIQFGKFFNPQVEREYESFKAGSASLQEKVERLEKERQSLRNACSDLEDLIESYADFSARECVPDDRDFIEEDFGRYDVDEQGLVDPRPYVAVEQDDREFFVRAPHLAEYYRSLSSPTNEQEGDKRD